MNTLRMIIILSEQLDTATQISFKRLCNDLREDSMQPIFVCGLHKDVTLSLTCRLPHVIHNAYEYLPLDNPTTQEILECSEVYTIMQGVISVPSQSSATPISVAQIVADQGT